MLLPADSGIAHLKDFETGLAPDRHLMAGNYYVVLAGKICSSEW